MRSVGLSTPTRQARSWRAHGTAGSPTGGCVKIAAVTLEQALAAVPFVVDNAPHPCPCYATDGHGELVAAATMDGAAPDTRLNAQRKAYTAARSDATSTAALAEKARADAAERASFDPFFTFFKGGVAAFEGARRVGAARRRAGLPGRGRRRAGAPRDSRPPACPPSTQAAGQLQRLDDAVGDPPAGELVAAHRVDEVRAARPTARRSRRRCARGAAARRGASGRRRARSRRPRGTTSRAGRRARSGTATRRRCGPRRSARRRRPSRRRARTPRSATRPVRARRAPRARRPGSPPDGAPHRALDVGRVPEVGGQVLPAAVGEHAHDDALVELVREPERRVDDRARGDAAEDALALEQEPEAGRRPRRSTRAASGRASRRRGSAARSRPRASAGPSPRRPAAARPPRRRRRGSDSRSRSPAPMSVPPVPRPATRTSTRSRAAAISAPVPS